MRQSKKEQGFKKATVMLLSPDFREARVMAETDTEAAEEWEGKPSRVRRGSRL